MESLKYNGEINDTEILPNITFNGNDLDDVFEMIQNEPRLACFYPRINIDIPQINVAPELSANKDFRILVKTDLVIETIIDKLKFLSSKSYSVLLEEDLVRFIKASFVVAKIGTYNFKMVNVDIAHEKLLRAVFFELSQNKVFYSGRQSLQENLSELMKCSFSCFGFIKAPCILSQFSNTTNSWMRENEGTEILDLVKSIRRK
jgi:hypothetical protein